MRPVANREVQYVDPFGVHELLIGEYPGGEPIVTLPSSAVNVTELVVRPRSVFSFMAALWFADAMRERGLPLASINIPYVPGARQDRTGSGSDFLFTAKSVAREINAREFRSVRILDPHSDVIAGLIDRVVVESVVDILEPCWGSAVWPKNVQPKAVIAPDAGASKRAKIFADHFGLPLFHAWKKRAPDGALSGFGYDPAIRDAVGAGESAIVVDDICDAGGTFVGLAEAMADEKFGLDLYVSHGIFSAGVGRLLGRYQNVVTTTSILNDDLVFRSEAYPDHATRRLAERTMRVYEGRVHVLPLLRSEDIPLSL